MVTASISVSSQAFSSGGAIPGRFTCSGADVSPPLSWAAVPDGAKSLALTVIDPDAPGRAFVHWVIFNLPPATSDLSEGATPPGGGVQGRNDFGTYGYRGPCPPPGQTHHYQFKVYALDSVTSLPEGASNSALQNVIKGHILAAGEIVGTFKR
jgi:Raf kinase inhibitor-like YbhB/YbcL family protein